MRLQGLCPGERAPTYPPPPATPLGAKAKTVYLLLLLYSSILTLNQINVLT